MSPADSLREVEFIGCFLICFSANDHHIRTLDIQMSKEIGRLHRECSNIFLLGESGREQMAAHRITVDDQEGGGGGGKRVIPVQHPFRMFFSCFPGSRRDQRWIQALKVVATRRLSRKRISSRPR